MLEGVKEGLADGDFISVPATVLETKYEYVDTKGAKRRVRVVKAGAPTEFMPLAQSDFVDLAKRKIPVAVLITGEKDCLGCLGDGKLSALQGGKGCGECDGKGTLTANTYYVVSW